MRTWLHCAHLQMGGQKMAKSEGNIARVAELLEARRLARARSATRSSRPTTGPALNFGDESLAAAAAAVDRLDALVAALEAYRARRARRP